MKKLISTLLAVLMLLTMAACGGTNPKLDEAIDTFNSLSDQFNEVAALVNENEGVIDADVIGIFNELSDMLDKYADTLENGEALDDTQLDAILGWFGTAKTSLVEVKTAVEIAVEAEKIIEDETEDENVFPEALQSVDAYEVPDVSYTGWQLAGGMIDGKEMEQEDLDAVLTACGGSFMFVFDAPGVVNMYNGETVFAGTYETVADNFAVYMAFEGYSYYGVFTTVEDTVVLIVANPVSPETALYMVAVDEH